MNPLVTVVIPAYKAEAFIAETIQSVIDQTYTNWELIIIDDGSPDNQKKIIEPFLADPRIQYHYQENAGVSAARNSGMDKSKGEFIAFLDADDMFLPNNLERKLAFLQKNKEYGLVHAYVQDIDKDSLELETYQIGKQGWVLDDLLIWRGEVIPAPSSILMPTKIAKEIGGWDTNFQTAADQEFFMRVAKQYKIGMIDEFLTYYRELPSSMSTNIPNFEEDHIRVFQKAKEHNLFKNKLFELQCFSNLYLIIAGSWWVDGGNKRKAFYFMFLSFIMYPPVLLFLIKRKFFK
jgi:glycosyltransferase involved in cell wall biosynthesis